MANKYQSSLAVLLNDGNNQQILPISKSQLIELANANKEKFNGYGVSNAATVEDALTYLLNKSVSDLTEAKAYTSSEIAALDGWAKSDTGYVLSYIVEENGIIRTEGNQTWLDASVVSYQGGEAAGAPTTVQGAIENVQGDIADIQSTLEGLAGEGEGSVAEQIADAIEDLTYNTAGTANKAVVAVTQTDGVIAPVQGNVDAEYINVDNTDNVFGLEGDSPATTLDAQTILEHLQGEIEDLDESAATYAIEKRTQNLDANVKEQYVLRQTVNGTTTDVQVPINIYKDSQLLAAGISTTDATYSNGNIVAGSDTTNALVLVYSVYKNDAWTEEVVHIPVADFFSSLTAGDGLTESNGVINVVKGANSENFLTVNSDSIEITGVQTAINTAETNAYHYVEGLIDALDSTLAPKVDTDNNYSYAVTGFELQNGVLVPASNSYAALVDTTIKTTEFDSNSNLYKLLGSTNLANVNDVHDALNAIAGEVKTAQGEGITNILGDTDNTYINITGEKNGNTYTLALDDSNLGNVALLHYDPLTSQQWSSTELANIFNPEV